MISTGYNLAQGTLVQARVAATNALGTSSYSATNTAGALIEVPPQKPAGITRGTSSQPTEIEIVIAPLTGTATGGAEILTYVIQSNGGGSGTTFTSKFGSVSQPALGTSFLDTGLQSGQFYTYRYFGVNRQGDGAISDETQILAATVPDAPSQPTVSYLSLKYTVDWTSPFTGGTGVALTAYSIEVKSKSGTFLTNAD